jgi:uncharacterized protein
MRIVLAGASGLIGSALAASLRQQGDQVDVLVRRQPSSAGEHSWDPAHDLLNPEFLLGAHAVVCLSGAGIGDHRWSQAYKQELIESRVNPVATIARAMAQLASTESDGPRVLLSASAVGYYGDRGDDVLTEESSPGEGFLAELCNRWEAAAMPATAAGLRVAILRTGLVLVGNGGLLGRLTPIVKAGVSGRLGTGRQFMPWISMLDELRAIEFLLDHDISGAVNLTGPEPARNADFTKALGSVLHRPTLVPTPRFALRAALGEFAGETLASQRVMPARLQSSGFEFSHPTLDSALRWALTS